MKTTHFDMIFFKTKDFFKKPEISMIHKLYVIES